MVVNNIHKVANPDKILVIIHESINFNDPCLFFSETPKIDYLFVCLNVFVLNVMETSQF